jgi:hypothetical protein
MNYPDIELPRIGILRYEAEYDWYEGQIKVQQSAISIRLSIEEEGELAFVCRRATNFVVELESHVQSAKEYAVERLLELKNETWIEENEEPSTPEQFKHRMVIESILIDSEGEVFFYHKDGNLFWGHCILVTMNSENNFISVEIAG